MRTCIIVGSAVIGLAAAEAVSSQSAVRRIDLTRPDVVKTRPSVSGATVRGLSGVADRPLPLTVRLVSVDRARYRRGDSIASELELTNSGTSTFAVPTSLDHRAFEHLDDTSTTMTFILEAVVGNNTQSITAVSLVGAPTEVESLLALAPGERLIVKVPSEIFRQPSPILKTSGDYPVRARVEVEESSRNFSPALSANMLTVSLQLSGGR